jgi:3-isopropylmalate/(R)-2-methylmalate dehydratase small subunit
MEPFKQLRSAVVPLVRDDVDTDQIIPARFLKVTVKQGLGTHLFSDWRYESDGSPRPDFVLDQAAFAGRQVLLAGHNFGCGSSREHAPWALTDWGFRAIIATSFADIFKNNAMGNGLLPVEVDAAAHGRLRAALEADPSAEVAIDLVTRTLTLPDGTTVEFPVDPFAQKCMISGTDRLGYIQSFDAAIATFEESHG